MAQRTQRQLDDGHRAVVVKITDGCKSPFVTTLPQKEEGSRFKAGDTVTFPLSEWRSDNPIQLDQVVLLTGVTLFRRGWRAASAFPIEPSTHVRGNS